MPSSTISFLFKLELLWVITRFRMVVGHTAATELLDAADLARKVKCLASIRPILQPGLQPKTAAL